MYERLTEGKPLILKTEDAAKVVAVMETVHAQNPLERKY